MTRQFGIRTALFFSTLLIGAAPSGWSQSPTSPPESKEAIPASPVVLTIGDHKLTAQQVERIIEALPPESRAFYGGQGKKFLPIYLVQMVVLSEEARKQDLTRDPQVQQAIENATEAILAHAERGSIEKSITISDAELEGLYEQKKGIYEQVRIRRLLLRTDASPIATPNAPARPPLSEAEARTKLGDLRKQILGGADFAQVAQKYSDDLATARAGGDMGYIDRLTVVPPIADAAYALNLGEVSDIIKTPYGMEIIKVEDRRVKPFSEVRQELEAELRKKKTDEALQRLIDQYKVVIDQQYFTSSPPASTGASPTLQHNP